MKAVMISINPKWCEKIASGEKTIEVRKTRPKIDTPFKCYIYCTFPKKPVYTLWLNRGKENRFLADGKVIGEFVCDSMYGIFNFLPYEADDTHHDTIPYVLEQTCLEDYEIDEYLGNKDGYGWHISDLVIYDEPKELSEFKTFCKSYYEGDNCDDCKYFIDCRGYEYDESDCACNGLKPIERPFQSWGYVEEKE